MQTHEIYFRFDMQKSTLYFRLVLEVNPLNIELNPICQ